MELRLRSYNLYEMELRFKYSLPYSRGYFLLISLPIIYISVLFLREIESHYSLVVVWKEVLFKHLLLNKKCISLIKIK